MTERLAQTIERLRERYDYAHEYLHLDEERGVDQAYTQSLQRDLSKEVPTMMAVIEALVQRVEVATEALEFYGRKERWKRWYCQPGEGYKHYPCDAVISNHRKAAEALEAICLDLPLGEL